VPFYLGACWKMLVVLGGIAHFLVVHGGKGNYPNNLIITLLN